MSRILRWEKLAGLKAARCHSSVEVGILPCAFGGLFLGIGFGPEEPWLVENALLSCLDIQRIIQEGLISVGVLFHLLLFLQGYQTRLIDVDDSGKLDFVIQNSPPIWTKRRYQASIVFLFYLLSDLEFLESEIVFDTSRHLLSGLVIPSFP